MQIPIIDGDVGKQQMFSSVHYQKRTFPCKRSSVNGARVNRHSELRKLCYVTTQHCGVLWKNCHGDHNYPLSNSPQAAWNKFIIISWGSFVKITLRNRSPREITGMARNGPFPEIRHRILNRSPLSYQVTGWKMQSCLLRDDEVIWETRRLSEYRPAHSPQAYTLTVKWQDDNKKENRVLWGEETTDPILNCSYSVLHPI